MIETRYRYCTNSLPHHLRSLCTSIPKRQLLNDAADSLENLEAERDALQAAKKACIDIYMDLHVSEMRGQPDHLRQAWSVGQELYIKKLEGQG